MRGLTAVLAASCVALAASFTAAPAPLALRAGGAATARSGRVPLGVSMQATQAKTRGQALLEKYQESKGLLLPLLTAEEEAKCVAVAEKAPEIELTLTAKMAAARVAPIKEVVVKKLTPEEQRELDEKAGRIEKDRTKIEHVSDGGWWGKTSPFNTAAEGGLARIAEDLGNIVDPEKEAALAQDREIRTTIGAARAALEELVHKNDALAKSLVALAWADASTFDGLGERKFGPRSGVVMRLWTERKWPRMHGANGSMRFHKESSLAVAAECRAGLEAVQSVKDKVPAASYADLFQLGAVVGIKSLGGPDIGGMLYGRCDVESDEACAPAAQHLGREGDKAGSVAEVLLRERCLLSEEAALALAAPGMLGHQFANPALSGPGRSGPFVLWASQRKFQAKINEWAKDEKAYFAAYAKAHTLLSQLGAKFVNSKGTVAEEPKAKAAVSLIRGWGGLGVHYDKETILAEGRVGEDAEEDVVVWNRGREMTAIFDEEQLVAALGEEEFGFWQADGPAEVTSPAEVSV